jgi:hypothetical protein
MSNRVRVGRLNLGIRTCSTRFSNFVKLLNTQGIVGITNRVFEMYLSPILNKNHIQLARIAAGKKLETILGAPKVMHGAFKGLNLEHFKTWGASDRGSQLLGLYEREVVNLIAQEGGPEKVFVDVGAAEGYFAAGVLVNKFFRRVICFEADAKSRNALAKTLSLNDVADLVSIHGAAGQDFARVVGEEISFDFKNTVILIDIEGGEIELLNQSNLEMLEQATIVVEMHPVQVAEADIRDLEILCGLTHQVDEIGTGERDPGVFQELKNFTDDERWLLCSEGRYRRGRWLVLRPKKKTLPT